jgi:hypothetical protein
MPALHSRLRRAALVACGLLLTTAAPAAADHKPGEGLHARPGQFLFSANAHGRAPNAPVTDPVISRDGRAARYVAYASRATDIAPGSDGHRNVFLARRADGFGFFGTPWRIGSVSVASRGVGGRPANGNSWGPALDGSTNNDTPIAPRCLAFVSDASNLVRGDDNGHADVFVRTLRGVHSGRLTRIETDGPATSVAVSGRCDRIAYVSGGRLFVREGRRTTLVRGARDPFHLSISESKNRRWAVVFEQTGAIRVSWNARPARTVVAGGQPAQDQYGRYVLYHRGGRIFQSNLRGPANERTPMRQTGLRVNPAGEGHTPALTAGGMHSFFVRANALWRNVTMLNVGLCPAGGELGAPSTSSRGNYVVYACSGGPVYMTYLGPKCVSAEDEARGHNPQSLVVCGPNMTLPGGDVGPDADG